MSDMRENVKAIIATGCGCDRACEQTGDCGCSRDADAAIAVALEQAARVAEGPPYRTSGTTGEVSIRGGDDGNWSVPMPLAGYKGSDYGTGRYDAAAAIRALIPSESETGERR